MNRQLLKASMGGALLLAGFAAASSQAEGKLQAVKDRGQLICGTDNTKPGFGYLNPQTGKLEGFDVDYCHAVAAGVLGGASKVKMITPTDKNRFNALQTGTVDVVVFHTNNSSEKRPGGTGGIDKVR